MATNEADPLNIKEEIKEELEKIDHKFDSKLGVLKIDDDSSNDADQDIKDEKTSIAIPQNLILLSEDGPEDVNPLPAVKSEDPLDINNCKLEDFDDEEEEEEDNDTKDADIKGIFVPKLHLKTEFSGVKRETQQESFKQEVDDVEENVVIKTEPEEICVESDNNEEGNTEDQDGLSDSDSNTESTPGGNSNAENIQPEDQSDTGHTSNSITQSTSVKSSKRKTSAVCSNDVLIKSSLMSDVSVVSNKSSSTKKDSTKKRKGQQKTKEASERETQQGILNKEVDDNNVEERVVIKTEPEEICVESDSNEEGNTELSDSDSNTESTPSGNSNAENIQPEDLSDTGHTSNSITQSTSVKPSKRKRSAVCSSDVLPDKPNKTVKSSLMSDVSVVSSNKRKNTGKQINTDNKSNSAKKCSTEKDSTGKRKEQQTKEASENPREISVKKNSVKANDENVKSSKKTKGRKVYKLNCPVLAYLCICGSWCKTGPELSNHLSVCSRLQPRVFLKRINS